MNMNKISVHDRAICLCFVYSLPLPDEQVAKYCSAHVCVSVSLLRVSNCVSKRRQSYACCLWSWICPYVNTFCFSFVEDVFSHNGRTQVTWCMLMVKVTYQEAAHGPGAVLMGRVMTPSQKSGSQTNFC